MTNKDSFDDDLERFEAQMKRELDAGLDNIKDTLKHHEFRLRSDIHSAIGGWVSFMKSKYGNGSIVLLLAVTFLGCNPPTSPDVSVYVNQVVSIADGGKPDGVVSGGSCAPVDRVNISASPSQLAVGQSERIDVTPKDINGKPRDPDCDIRSGVDWDSNEDVCRIKDEEEFVTEVVGVKSGSCRIEACVESKCDSETFEVK